MKIIGSKTREEQGEQGVRNEDLHGFALCQYVGWSKENEWDELIRTYKPEMTNQYNIMEGNPK